MKRYLGIDGVQQSWGDCLLWWLKVASIIVAGAVVVLLLILLHFMISPVHAQEEERGWQLGICVDDPDVGRRCRLVGEPLPDKVLCESLKQSLQGKIAAGKVHCTRVLIGGQS